MKKTLKLAVITLCSFLAPALAHADTGMYFGVNYLMMNYKETDISTMNPTALSLKLGNKFSENLAFEARAGVGISDDSASYMGIPVSLEISNFFGVYGKGIAPISDNFSIYGLVGFSSVKVKANAMGYSVSDSDSGLSFGVGADISMSETAMLNIEWAQLLDASDFKLSALSLGFSWNF